MPRTSLAPLKETRGRFRGCVERYGAKRGTPDATILLKDVIDVASGNVVADHVWLDVGDQIRRLRSRQGDHLEFDATVTGYTKGYFGHRDETFKPPSRDWRLSYHRSFKLLDSDGIEIDVGGPPRVMQTGAGFFVIGRGLRWPEATKESAEKRLRDMIDRDAGLPRTSAKTAT